MVKSGIAIGVLLSCRPVDASAGVAIRHRTLALTGWERLPACELPAEGNPSVSGADMTESRQKCKMLFGPGPQAFPAFGRTLWRRDTEKSRPFTRFRK